MSEPDAMASPLSPRHGPSKPLRFGHQAEARRSSPTPAMMMTKKTDSDKDGLNSQDSESEFAPPSRSQRKENEDGSRQQQSRSGKSKDRPPVPKKSSDDALLVVVRSSRARSQSAAHQRPPLDGETDGEESSEERRSVSTSKRKGSGRASSTKRQRREDKRSRAATNMAPPLTPHVVTKSLTPSGTGRQRASTMAVTQPSSVPNTPVRRRGSDDWGDETEEEDWDLDFGGQSTLDLKLGGGVSARESEDFGDDDEDWGDGDGKKKKGLIKSLGRNLMRKKVDAGQKGKDLKEFLDNWTTQVHAARAWPPQTDVNLPKPPLIDADECKQHGYSLETGCSSVASVVDETMPEEGALMQSFFVDADENLQTFSAPRAGQFGWLENEDRDVPYYQLYFFRNEHINYVINEPLANEPNHPGPVFVSITKQPVGVTREGNHQLKIFRALIRNKDTDARAVVKAPKVQQAMAVLNKEHDLLRGHKFKLLKSMEARTDLARLEKELLLNTKNYKFGVLYCAPGQSDENDMYNNQEGSAAFDYFLSVIGKKVTLQGYEGFAGGLDVKTNTTGLESVSTKFRGHEYMYHVSTLIHYTPGDPQQVERKRHLGNDVLVVVFQDDDGKTPVVPFKPKGITSHFNHVFVVVRPVPAPKSDEGSESDDDSFFDDPDGDGNDGSSDDLSGFGDDDEEKKPKKKTKPPFYWQVAVVCKDGVQPFGPPLPDPPLFCEEESFRDWFLAKLINGERGAVLGAATFRDKLVRTKNALMREVCRQYQL